MTPDVETVVIGAGVVGLAIARALTVAGHEVAVLERHAGIGRETSSRSSEVIHAGLYYPPGTLKARLCVEGRRLLYDFARENGVAHQRYGKLVVAIEAAELPRLESLAATARANGVSDVALLSAAEAKTLEPEIACAAALLSPSTGAIDSHALMVALEGHVRSRSGSVLLNTAVERIEREASGAFSLATSSGGEMASITARNLVIAAGLGASRLGRMLSEDSHYHPPETYPARGHYYTLNSAPPFRHLLYPLPGEGWLGIHLTLDVAGRARFGPDLEWSEEPSTVFDAANGQRQKRFEDEIRRYWPGLPMDALSPGYVGVRPKIYREGEPVSDFAIHDESAHGIPRLVSLYGIESPGLTASLAIADDVAARIGS
jgi:L-2-hydroxyglutarate oxidase LhgO